MASKLENQVALGLHLSAGASDGYLTSAEFVYDETKAQSIQATIDEIKTSTGDISDFTVNGKKISTSPVLTGDDVAVSASDSTTVADKLSSIESGKVAKEDGKGLSTNDYTTAEKTKLAGIETGAQKNQNAFSTVAIITQDQKLTGFDATDPNDSFTLTAGNNVQLVVVNESTKELEIHATDTTYSAASSSADGLMSASDKAKLDGITASATADEALTETEIDAAIAAA